MSQKAPVHVENQERCEQQVKNVGTKRAKIVKVSLQCLTLKQWGRTLNDLNTARGTKLESNSEPETESQNYWNVLATTEVKENFSEKHSFLNHRNDVAWIVKKLSEIFSRSVPCRESRLDLKILLTGTCADGFVWAIILFFRSKLTIVLYNGCLQVCFFFEEDANESDAKL